MGYFNKSNLDTVEIDNLGGAIEAILEEYGDEVIDVVQKAAPKVTRAAARRLRNTSPKKTGKYAASWTHEIVNGRLTVESQIYNRHYPGLTHLLENGHENKYPGRRSNGKYGILSSGFVNGIPHIKPVEEWASNEFEKVIKEDISRL